MRGAATTQQERVPVVLLGVGLPGLDIARSLGRRGIRVIAVDWRRTWGCRSRYICAAFPQSRSEGHLLDLLLRLGARLGTRPLLMPLNDDYVIFVSRHRGELAASYRFLMPDPSVTEALVSKFGLWSLCNGNGVALPATHFARAGADLERLAPRLPYPCIIKPNFSRDWAHSRPPMIREAQKVIEIRSPAELGQVSEVVGPGSEVAVQEVIPGPDSNLYYLAVYFDQHSEPLGAFVGRKLRTEPPHFGKGTYVESVRDAELIHLGTGLLQRLAYKGCGGVEFKLDPRDGVFKLIEINARFGLWDGFAAQCGLDLAYLAYADAMGLPLPPRRSYRVGVRWVQLDRDFWAAAGYLRGGEMSLGSWLRSLIGCRVFAPAAVDDLSPFVALNLIFGRDAAAAARRRLGS
jgi:predicted ATP-grasp superfamily ATP-dependent carboligase